VTLPRLWAFLAMALPALAALVATLSSVDLTYQLRAGAEILDTRAVPRVDTWTFTVAGQPWFDQQWGAQVLLKLAYDGAGWTGLVLLRAGLVAVTFGCALLVARGAGLPNRSAALLTLAAFAVAAPALALRPQLFGLALFALVLLILDRRRVDPRVIWLIPLLVLVWANLHGSFFLGPLAVGLTWLADMHRGAERPHRLLAVALLSMAAACVTPFGPAVWAYAAGLSTDPSVTGRITEWQRTSVTDVAGLLFYGSLVAVVALVVRRRSAVDWPLLLWLAVFAGIGAWAVRGIAWWALAAVPMVAALAAAAREPGVERPGTPSMQRLNAILAGAMVVVGIALLPIWRPVDPRTGTPQGLVTDAPPGVTATLRALARPGDHLYNPQPWGSWTEFALPDLLVTVDSRVELFPPAVWADYDAVRAGAPGWEAILARWKVTLVALEPGEDALRERLVSAGWMVASTDASGTVLHRSDR
jgi:hypothetical protein